MANGFVHWGDKQALMLINQSHKAGESLTHALRSLTDVFGYIDERAITPLMQTFALSRAEILGVTSYYDDFRDTPPARHVIRLCQAEACQAVGGRELSTHLFAKTGLALGEAAKNGQVALEAVYCLGLCANGPAGQIDDKPAVHLDAAILDAKLAELDQ